MKKLALLIVIALSLGACAPESEDKLTLLKNEKDSLKEVKGEIGDRLAEIELELATLDTTKAHTLVTYKNASIGKFERFFRVYGSLESDQNATIYPEINGAITNIRVKEGQRVNRGDILMVLDVQIMREQEEELKTRLSLAETTYKKQKQLWDKNVGSEMQYLQAKNNYEALKNQLSALRAQIEKGTIRAPYAGVVDEIFPKKGEVAMPGMGLVRLINSSDMYIEADISENYVGKVKEGDAVTVSVNSLGYERPSTIERIGKYINPNNRTFKIRVGVDNSDGMLKPNMVALIRVNDVSIDSTVTIPTSLILDGAENRQFVFVLRDSGGTTVAQKRTIEVPMSYKGISMVAMGLNGNERIVDKGARSIRNGEIVEIKE